MSGKCPICDLQCLWGDLIRFVYSTLVHSDSEVGGDSSFQPGFAHRKRKGVGRRDEEKERKKTEKRSKKTAKEPPALADITEEKEEEQALSQTQL